MLIGPLPPLFLDTCFQFLSSLGFKSLCIISNILSTGSFVFVLPLSILRMMPSLLQGILIWYLFLWWDFCCKEEDCWDTLVLNFLHFFALSLFYCFRLGTCKFPFLWEFEFFLYFGSSIPSDLCLFLLFFMNMARFSMRNPIPKSWQYICNICFFSCCQIYFPVFHGFRDNFISYMFRQEIRGHIITFFRQLTPRLPRFSLFEDVLIYIP